MMFYGFWYLLLAFATLSHAIAAPPVAKPPPSKPQTPSRPNSPNVRPAPIPEPAPAPKPVDPKPADSDPKPAAPKPAKPPKLPSNPNKPIPRLPIVVKNEGDDSSSVFDLGTYKEDEPALFQKFDDRSKPFFSVMYNFFEVKGTYLPKTNAYAEATGQENPFNSGSRPTGQPLRVTQTITSPATHTVTASFDPRKPLDACRAWTNLATYCSGGGEACACYSGTYYVPDQWNSLAAGCAEVTSKCPKESSSSGDGWCAVASTAASHVSYCTNSFSASQSPSPVRFAEKANIETPRSASATTTSTRSGSSNDNAAPFPSASDRPVIIVSDHSALFPTSSPTSRVSSWSPRLVDPIAANMYSWLVLLASLLYCV
ncbi:hypothetical protein DM02DRAFT_655693 [Periconia macrospinosa]|uniref:Extracellular membrane protein CFEM domain-containing protein n=1 Tax=Periconia macrospinosa TaxID=97972 RepID=A0A2V1DPW6_9PLEO|nr:hypothetical protein DM02DRAFT_655693 [Periconia macrospinosa]